MCQSEGMQHGSWNKALWQCPRSQPAQGEDEVISFHFLHSIWSYPVWFACLCQYLSQGNCTPHPKTLLFVLYPLWASYDLCINRDDIGCSLEESVITNQWFSQWWNDSSPLDVMKPLHCRRKLEDALPFWRLEEFVLVSVLKQDRTTRLVLANAIQSGKKLTPFILLVVCDWELAIAGGIKHFGAGTVVFPVAKLASMFWLFIAALRFHRVKHELSP